MAETRHVEPTSLRDYLVAHGISQTALADRLGVSQPTVSRWVTGQATPRELRRVAEALGLPLEALVPDGDGRAA